MPAPGQNWQRLSPYGQAQPGTPVQGALPGQVGSPGGVQALLFRNPLDAERAQIGNRIPAAEYPDGYLGTIQSRRENKLLGQVREELNQRSSQRGVHVGEKINPADYFWPDSMRPDRGLEREAMAVPQADGTMASPRFAPMMTMLEQMQADGTRIPQGPHGPAAQTPYVQNPEENRAALAMLLPDWSL